jgi:peptidoglycan-associated lipoprotein
VYTQNLNDTVKRLTSIILPTLIFLLTAACNTAKLSTAEAEFDRGEYFQAASTYRKIYNKTSATKERRQRARIAERLAVCYDRLNMPARATASYSNALRYGATDSTLLLAMARCQHNDGKYRDAVKSYEQYLALDPDNRLALDGLKGAREAQQMKERRTRYEVRRMDIFNSRRCDFSPAILGKEGEQVYITSANDKNTGADKSEITGLKACDIYVSSKDEKGVWQKPEALEGGVNTEFDEGTPAFSPDGNTMYFTRARRDAVYPTSTEIFYATRAGGKWGDAKKLEITRDTISLFAHPAVSPDGKWLYFTSDMPGGQGGKDLWRAPITATGVGAVENLGDQINTAGDEVFPTFRPDGMLHFSSDGHPGMGGLDIFRAREDEWGQWHIANLGSPVNSAGDDFGMTFFAKEEEQGFFASNRGDARGYDHIYSFYLPSIKVRITGLVTDRDEEPIASAIVRVVGLDGSNHKIVTKNDGTFETRIDRDVRYVMMAGAPGYLNAKEEFRSESDEADATYHVEFQLASISKPVLIDNIFYDFDRATLRPESRTALDELITLLNDNPNVTIELAAHTDRKGSDDYNIALSQRRAASVVDYLIAGGIDRGRLTARGYGESRPKEVTPLLHRTYPFLPEGQVLDEAFVESLPEEQQEVADQINRRTEFQVLTITWGLE